MHTVSFLSLQRIDWRPFSLSKKVLVDFLHKKAFVLMKNLSIFKQKLSFIQYKLMPV